MMKYPDVRSTVRPEPLVIRDNSVVLATDITEICENEGADNEFVGFGFNMQVYTKDEYILKLSEDVRQLHGMLEISEV